MRAAGASSSSCKSCGEIQFANTLLQNRSAMLNARQNFVMLHMVANRTRDDKLKAPA